MRAQLPLLPRSRTTRLLTLKGLNIIADSIEGTLRALDVLRIVAGTRVGTINNPGLVFDDNTGNLLGTQNKAGSFQTLGAALGTPIANNLTTSDPTNALGASQGGVLNAAVLAAASTASTASTAAASATSTANSAATAAAAASALAATKTAPGDFKTVGGVSIIGTGNIPGGSGDVLGPVASVDNELPLFSSTTGKAIKRSNTLSGFLQLTSGAVSALTASALKTAISLVKGDVGLGSVDNTADTAKPVSAAQQSAIDAKVQNSMAASTTVAPSATAVSAAIAAKQDALISGTSIKTVNSVSLLGAGDIPISGGGGAPTTVIYATAIPLDVTDEAGGKVMTTDGNARTSSNERIAITTNTVLTAGARVINGYCLVLFYMDGTHTVDPSFAIDPSTGVAAAVFTGTANHLYSFAFTSVAASAAPQVFIKDLGVSDLTAPTLVSATVANASPTHIDLVWSEPMNSTISAFGAFAVSAGHTLTAPHTYVDSTHSYLTTSTAFVNAEAARTLAYTQPGSNKMQDSAGNLLANFSGTAVTNNVAGTASLTSVLGTVPGSVILTAVDGTLNWAKVKADALSPINAAKASPSLGVIIATESNAPVVFDQVTPGFPGITTDGSDREGGGSTTNDTLSRTVGAGTPGTPTWEQLAIPVPAGACTVDLYVWASLGTGETLTITASLSDGSATMTPRVMPTSSNAQLVTLTKAGGSATTTLNLRATYSNEIGAGAMSAAVVMVR